MSNLHPRSVRTQAEILDVAWKLFARKGSVVSMAEVAEAAGLTRQAIYVHFRSRGGLLVALVRRADEREDIHARFRTALAIKEPARRLDAFLSVWFDFVRACLPIASTLMRARGEDAEAAAAWEDRMEELRGGYRSLTSSLRRDGALAAGWTPASAADYLWAGSSMQVFELLEGRGWSDAKISKTLRATLANSILA